ncbi:MAG TPA: hypothetical protein VJN22_07690 [Candidatus Eremiobacteraceae bacterium]|nr:hypothetical protein [Candidatus Eremiobacteraceae bacterium]
MAALVSPVDPFESLGPFFANGPFVSLAAVGPFGSWQPLGSIEPLGALRAFGPFGLFASLGRFWAHRPVVAIVAQIGCVNSRGIYAHRLVIRICRRRGASAATGRSNTARRLWG